jgi:hypothetical protein
MRFGFRTASALLMLTGCAAQPPLAAPIVERPLAVMPAGLDVASVRADLVATARSNYGSAALARALGSPNYLIVKRFAGMVPPPPPGTPADWTPPTPTALLVKDGASWMVATANGWRPANAAAGNTINTILAEPQFRNEPAFTPPCPDFGSGNLVLKTPGRAETVRIAQCMSKAASLVEAALRA